jgi:hypothetical protein
MLSTRPRNVELPRKPNGRPMRKRPLLRRRHVSLPRRQLRSVLSRKLSMNQLESQPLSKLQRMLPENWLHLLSLLSSLLKRRKDLTGIV